jgi:hypothetical protein
MGAYTLRLFEDHLQATARLSLAATPRIVYVLAGAVVVTAGSGSQPVAADRAWHGTGGCSLAAGPGGATILRYELLRGQKPAEEARPALLAHALALDDAGRYLMRCDRVDFAPGGEALRHGHKGGGIRCLIAGELEVRVGGGHGRVMKPGDAWFESGVEPVYAIASVTVPTSFIRVSILPRSIRGQSSIVYVDPAHAAVKPRKYTVFVDEPIALP